MDVCGCTYCMYLKFTRTVGKMNVQQGIANVAVKTSDADADFKSSLYKIR